MIRSLLYVPAHSERFIAKAHERQADAVILDLEDSVPLEAKTAAREALADSIASVRRGGAKVFVRINSDDEAQLPDSVAACVGGADGLMVPKISNPDDLSSLATIMECHEKRLGRDALQFIGLIEDPGAVLNAAAIARAPRLIGLAIGGEDLATAMGATPTPSVLHFPKLLVHYAAKAAGILSLGLLRTIADYSDLDAITIAIREAREHGFDGATCVHPTAVPLLNAGFAPSPAEIAWATRVLALAETNKGAFSVDGQMIDAPVLARARSILLRA